MEFVQNCLAGSKTAHFSPFFTFFQLRSSGYAPSKTQKLANNQPVFASLQTILNKLLALVIILVTGLPVAITQNCNTLVRRSIGTYTQAEMDVLTSAILAMKTRPSLFDQNINAYDYFVVLHFEASVDHGSAAHHSPGFLPWHRELLLRFEEELRVSTGNPEYMLPYWMEAKIGDGLHGRVHIFVGGNMVSKSSPNDPVFLPAPCQR